jgi:hypothetical protein
MSVASDKYINIWIYEHGLVLKSIQNSRLERRVWALCRVWYSRIISTKSAASCAGNVTEPRLISQLERLREFVRAISVFLQSEWWRWQYWSAYVAAEVVWYTKEGLKFCEVRAELCHAKWRGLCECNPAISTATVEPFTLVNACWMR